jgi:hypothetical protein
VLRLGGVPELSQLRSMRSPELRQLRLQRLHQHGIRRMLPHRPHRWRLWHRAAALRQLRSGGTTGARTCRGRLLRYVHWRRDDDTCGRILVQLIESLHQRSQIAHAQGR